jgi:GTP-binding protein YchF
MLIGIVGLPYTGKTTVFNALTGLSAPTGKYSDAQGEINRGVVSVPDERLDRLAEMYKPKKITHATIEFCDVAGFRKGASSDASVSAYLLGQLRDMDALAMTVRVFERDSVPHPGNRIDPVADLDTLLTEFNLADLAIAEKRCQRLGEQLKKGTQEERDKLAHEKQIIERIIATLNAGHPLRTLELTHEEQAPIRGFGFLSQKPLLVLANVGDFTSEIEQKRLAELEKYCQDAGLRMLAINGDLECELRQIEAPHEQKEYMDAMGIERRAAGAVIQAAYQITHSETFLTAGEPEVRAWTIPVGSKAVEAAGKIHSDIARGFIRAEVVPYEHLIHDGSIAKAREAGHYREEGKEAIIKDGDVIYYRFNV